MLVFTVLLGHIVMGIQWPKATKAPNQNASQTVVFQPSLPYPQVTLKAPAPEPAALNHNEIKGNVQNWIKQ